MAVVIARMRKITINKHKISDQSFALAAATGYTVVVSALSLMHVVWRDEVAPLNMMAYCSSLAQAFALQHDVGAGHPALWPLLLYAGYHVFHTYSILKLLNLAICISGIYIFLRFSPFPRFQKILFILGFFTLFYYPVFNRNYGISMLFAFVFAALYPLRFEKRILLGAALFLLSNTHVHSLIMVAGILGALVFEFLTSFEARRAWGTRPAESIVALLLIGGGIACSVVTITPPHTSIIYHYHSMTLMEVIKPFFHAVLMPGKAFPSVLGVYSWVFSSLVIFCMYLYLLPKPALLVFFGVTVIGLNMFYYLMFPSEDMRHQGAFYLLLVTALWLDYGVKPGYSPGEIFSRLRNLIVPYREPFFIFLLILQVTLGLPAIKNDFLTPYSSSKELAQLLNKDPQFKNAVLIGEMPRLASLSYYANNAIYNPREGRFGNFLWLTTEEKLHFTLNDLLNAGEAVRRKTGRKVLFVVTHNLSDRGPFNIEITYGRDFSYTKDSLAAFNRRTRRIAVFDLSPSDENYSVYLLK